MSKQFEEEYKALADREAPDLWARIEAGLTPRSTTLSDVDVREEIGEKEQVQSGKILIFMRRYGAVAAAVVCVAILLPSILLVNRIGQKSYSAGAADMAEAPQMAMKATEAEFEEEASAEMAEMTDEAPAMEEPVCEAADAGAVFMEAKTESVKEAVTEEDAADAEDAEDAADTVVAEDQKNSMSTVRGTEAEAELLQDVTVTVLKNHGMSLTETEEDLEQIGTVYTVEIVEDPSGSLEAGVRVDVLLSVFASSCPTEGESCRMTLQREEDSEAFAYRIWNWQPVSY